MFLVLKPVARKVNEYMYIPRSKSVLRERRLEYTYVPRSKSVLRERQLEYMKHERLMGYMELNPLF